MVVCLYRWLYACKMYAELEQAVVCFYKRIVQAQCVVSVVYIWLCACSMLGLVVLVLGCSLICCLDKSPPSITAKRYPFYQNTC